VAKVPMKRIGQPSEIAGAVAFLASADASFMTGSEVTGRRWTGANLSAGSGVQAKRRTQVRLFLFLEACHFVPPEGSGDVAVFISRNQVWAVSPGA